MLNRRMLVLTNIVLLLALPLTVFAAESAAFNPPGWVGALMFFLALALPLAVSVWLRNRR